MLIVGGMISGDEIQTLRLRLDGAKRALHLAGRHASSKRALPRGVDYDRTRDPRTGKTVAGEWQHDGIDTERVRKAGSLLLSTNLSFEEIAARIGGGWTGKGIKESLQNPIWIGERRFQWTGGEEYTPTKRDGTTGKKRRRAIRIEPTRVRIDIPHLFTDEEFARVQEIIAEHALTFRKSKEKNIGRPRHLAGGLGRCPCRKPLYTQYGGRGSHLDTYYCPGRCGARRIKRDPTDQTIRRIVTERLLDVAFLRTLLAAVVKKAKQPSDAGRAKLEAALAKLEKGRKEQVLSMAMGDLSPGAVQGSRRRSRLRELQAMLPAPPMPDADAKDYLECIVRAFAEFSMLPFADQREILRRTVREVVIDGRRSPSIPSTTLNGGFLAGFRSRHSGCGANSKLPSRPRC